jgi:hypothetical protein
MELSSAAERSHVAEVLLWTTAAVPHIIQGDCSNDLLCSTSSFNGIRIAANRYQKNQPENVEKTNQQFHPAKGNLNIMPNMRSKDQLIEMVDIPYLIGYISITI